MMTQWDSEQLRQVLMNLPETRQGYRTWWMSSIGRSFMKQLERFVAPHVITFIKRNTELDSAIEIADVISTAYIKLEPANLVLRRNLTDEKVKDTFAYLCRSLQNEFLEEQIGRGFRRELQEFHAVSDMEDQFSTDDLFGNIIPLILDVVAPWTPQQFKNTLQQVVEAITERAMSGDLSRAANEIGNDKDLQALGWEKHQLMALVNILIGPRPNHGEASVIGRLLLNPEWTARFSLDMTKALSKYETVMTKRKAIA